MRIYSFYVIHIYIYLLKPTFSWNLISQIIWNVNLRKYLCIISNSQGYTWSHIIVCHILCIFPLANQYSHPTWRWRAIIISYSVMSLSFKKKKWKPSMYFIKSFSVITHIFGICKVYSHHWFLIFIYVSHVWNLKSSTHFFTLNYSTSIFQLCYPHLEVLYQSLFFYHIN